MSAIGTALERLSARDRALLVVLLGVVLVGGTAMAWQVVSGKHRARERRLATNQTHLETLHAGREAYLKRQAKIREREGILRIKPPQLRRYLEGVARNVGVTIDDLKDRPVAPPPKPTDIEETSMEARLTNVAYDKVVKLLAEVESSQSVVLVRELRMDYKGENTFREMRFTVSTFHLKGGTEAPAAGKGVAPAPAPASGTAPAPAPAPATGTAPAPAPAPAPASAPATAPAPAPATATAPAPAKPPAPPSPVPPAVSPAGAAPPSPRLPSFFRRDFGGVQPHPGKLAPPSLVAPVVEPPVPVKLPPPPRARGGTR